MSAGPAPQVDARVDVLIVGQGLAGSCLGWALEERGLSFHLVDPGPAAGPASSRLAAGLVTPLTGPRLTVNWRLEQLVPVADAFYRRTEAGLGATFWRSLEIVRLLLDPGLRAIWDKRSRQAAAARVSRVLPGPLVNPEGAAAPHGALVMPGWQLDCPGWLEASRRRWQQAGRLTEAMVDPADLDLRDDGAAWRGHRATTVVWCTGAALQAAPWFSAVTCRHQVGDVLLLEPMPALGDRVINGGAWLLADRDATGQPVVRAGATYFETARGVPSPPEARAQLLARLARLGLELSAVRQQQRAVRPVIAGMKVVSGPVPGVPRLAWLNGFGSKGVLKAPHFARNLAAHLDSRQRAAIDPDAVLPEHGW